MSVRRRPGQRLFAIAFGLVTAAVLLLALEGACSLFAGRSLLRRAVDPSARLMDALDDKARRGFANLTTGPFDLDLDPEVGHRTKGDHVFAWNDVPAHTDAFGMRLRPGGWPPAPGEPDGRPRWVVLGDSVAFGYGVADDQTYAARLEAHLATIWPLDGPSPAVLTVGAPGWNLQASIRFLKNHLDRYAPSLVLLVPVDNDLENRFVPTSSGGRAFGVDPAYGMTRISIAAEGTVDLRVGLSPFAPLTRVAQIAAAGGLTATEHVLVAGLAPASRRRYDEAAAAVVDLQRALARRAASLCVAFTWAQLFERELARRLAARAPDLPVGFLFDEWQPGDGCEGDSRPNPSCIDAGAIRMLQLAASHALLPPGCDAAALALPAAYAQRVVDATDAAEAWLRARRQVLEKYCGPRIDLRDATGFQQVYAGVEPDGTVGAQARIALRGEGGERTLVLRVRAPAVAAPLAGLRIGCAFVRDPAAPDPAPRAVRPAMVRWRYPTASHREVHAASRPIPAGRDRSGPRLIASAFRRSHALGGIVTTAVRRRGAPGQGSRRRRSRCRRDRRPGRRRRSRSGWRWVGRPGLAATSRVATSGHLTGAGGSAARPDAPSTGSWSPLRERQRSAGDGL